MTTIVFDTHKFIRTLKESGIPEGQAEAISEAFRAAHVEADLATKADLNALELSVRGQFSELKFDLIKWMTGALIAQAAVIAALVKLL
ncbi:Protein of unknown function [Allochromatium warmingii]|uniref:DUF1640 domain-containing protein n=1 Tax=Allochromatium warmingii TaxID=61595 RepID=A0A1H3JSG0_ALLWA|nr:coiled-coil domain-containing protein [Allochromatium warmingii]SDY42910.1 Protein of unknown function [Allochromatium warmingii]